jgi:hypothetical protein
MSRIWIKAPCEIRCRVRNSLLNGKWLSIKISIPVIQHWKVDDRNSLFPHGKAQPWSVPPNWKGEANVRNHLKWFNGSKISIFKAGSPRQTRGSQRRDALSTAEGDRIDRIEMYEIRNRSIVSMERSAKTTAQLLPRIFWAMVAVPVEGQARVYRNMYFANREDIRRSELELCERVWLA